MEKLTILKRIYKSMMLGRTLKQFNDWRKSEDGLRLICKAMDYDPNFCANEFSLLKEIHRKKQSEEWDRALWEAFGIDWSTGKYKNKPMSQELIIEAERLCVERGIVPPTFRTPYWCENCGEVLVKSIDSTCPWCPTLGADLAAVRKELPQKDKVSA